MEVVREFVAVRAGVADRQQVLALRASDRPVRAEDIGARTARAADVFCTDRPIARPEREDLLAIGNAGAYGYELANHFHSQPRPAEVAIDGEETRVVRRHETLADVTRVEQDF